MTAASLVLALAVLLLPAVIAGCRPAQPPQQPPTSEQSGSGQSGSGQSPVTQPEDSRRASGQLAPERSVAEQSVAEQSVAEQSVAEQSVAERSVAEQAAAEQAAPEQPVPEQPAPEHVAAAMVSPAAAACGTVRAGFPATRDGYKHDVACRIHARNGARLYEGAPPPVLRSVVVLSLRIDAKGRPVKIGVLRSNGIRDLERRAMQSVRDAAPFSAPGTALLRQGVADITETWLFRDDGRFQVRTLAMVQAQSGY